MNNFPEYIRFEIGEYADQLISWLVRSYGTFFDAIRDVIIFFLNSVEAFLLWIPWWFILILVFAAGWRLKRLTTGLAFVVLLMLVGSFGLWDLTMFTLAIVLTSVAISLAFGIPLGVMMSANIKLEAVLKPLLDAMQTMPSFVYLIPAVMLFRLGKVPAVFATTIYAIPPVIRLTNHAIRQVDREMVEAARSFGSSPWQLLVKVQLPQALPTIMTGINQTTMMAMAMVVISSMIGAKGLGMEVLIAINRLEIGRGFEAGLAIVIVAIIIDRISQGLARKFRVPE
jgi:glycine betaine/proline transport system permease protein